MTKIKAKKPINCVMDFHRTFDHPIAKGPKIPYKSRQNLRINLMQEELNEIKEAFEKNDIVGVADGLADLQYVLFGCVIECGLQSKFSDVFNEVHRSNMSKACNTLEDSLYTIEDYKTKDGTLSTAKKVGDKYVVYRTSDSKVLKSINYSPANLKPIIDGK